MSKLKLQQGEIAYLYSGSTSVFNNVSKKRVLEKLVPLYLDGTAELRGWPESTKQYQAAKDTLFIPTTKKKCVVLVSLHHRERPFATTYGANKRPGTITRVHEWEAVLELHIHRGAGTVAKRVEVLQELRRSYFDPLGFKRAPEVEKHDRESPYLDTYQSVIIDFNLPVDKGDQTRLQDNFRFLDMQRPRVQIRNTLSSLFGVGTVPPWEEQRLWFETIDTIVNEVTTTIKDISK